MASRKTSPPKSSKAVAKDLEAIDPEPPWVKLLKEAIAAIRDHQSATRAQLKAMSAGSKEDRAEFLRILDQIKVELLTDAFNGRIRLGESLDPMVRQLAGINQMLREKTKNERFVRHGRVVTAANFGEEIDRIEKAADERYEAAIAIARTKNEENDRLRAENDRLRADLKKVAAAFPEVTRTDRPKAKRSAEAKHAKETSEAPSPPFVRQYEIA